MGLAHLRLLSRYVRSLGLRRASGAVWGTYLFSHRRWYVFHKKPAPRPPPDDDFEYRLATPEDADRLAVFDAYRPHRQLCDWLQEDGTYLFIATSAGNPVAFNSVGRLPLRPPFARLKLAAHQIWIREAYAAPEFRRRRVSSHLIAYRNRVLRELGIDEVITAVLDGNIASLRLTYDLDVRLVQRISYVRVLGLGWTWIEEDARSRLEAALGEAGFRASARTPG